MLSLQGQRDVPEKTAGHQEAVGSVGRSEARTGGAGLDSISVVLGAEVPQ